MDPLASLEFLVPLGPRGRWDEAAWDGGLPGSGAAARCWASLERVEEEAALLLGYDQVEWDAEVRGPAAPRSAVSPPGAG